MTNSGVHNPTGASLAAATAHRVLQIARAHDVLIVEDNVFGDFEFEPAPRLAAYDGLDGVIRIGSFSKSVSAGIRCGHVAARRDWIESLGDLRIATSMSGNPLSADVLYSVLTDGGHRRHLEAIRTRLSRAMARTSTRLRAAGFEPWIESRAGMFLWARAPAGLDAVALARAALRENIVLAPGAVFSPRGDWRDHLRFNVAMADDERLYDFLTRAAARPERIVA